MDWNNVDTQCSGDRMEDLKDIKINKGDLKPRLDEVKQKFYNRNLWAGGFLGMSDKGIEILKTELQNFIGELQDVASQFNENGSIEMAFKGTVKEAVQDYIKSIKELINAYVTVVNNGVHDADTAFENWKTENKTISGAVGEKAQSVRANANSIRVD